MGKTKRVSNEFNLKNDLINLKVIVCNPELISKKIVIDLKKELLIGNSGYIDLDGKSNLSIIRTTDYLFFKYGSEKINATAFTDIYELAIFCMGLLMGLNKTHTSRSVKKLQSDLEFREDKGRSTLPMKLKKEMEQLEKFYEENKRRKPVKLHILIEANRKLNLFAERELIFELKPTELGKKILDSYKSQRSQDKKK